MKKKTDIDDRTCTCVSNEYFFLRFQVIWEEKTLHRSNFDVFIKLPRHTLMVIYMHVFQVHYKRTTSFYFNCHFHNETLQANLDSVNQLFFAITLFRDLPKKTGSRRYFRDLNADYLKSIIAKIFEDGSRREIFDEANADLAKISRTYANKT